MSNSFVGRRSSALQLTSLVAALVGIFTLNQVQAQQPIKIDFKPQTVTFVGGPGEGGSPCTGFGMCRGVMLGENETILSHQKTENFLSAEGRFAMQDGKLQFILTHVAATNGTNITNVRSFPFDRDAELPRNIARSLGFAGVRVFKGRYAASMEGIFPVFAKFSTGLNAAAVPAPRGERHASVSFEVLRQMNVSAIILDANGNKVATLLNNAAIAGSETPQTLAWNGKNDAGKRMASGEY
ncbi:MAG: hypothetical protein MUF71_21350, partial [Candidatus Kapabacteria bacterium]|nr:hypothetical protein [Candidatus Kapabacteria bacterium]